MEKRRTMRPVRHRDIETLYARLGSPVAFYLSLSQLAGSIPAGLLLSQSLYWTSHGRDIDANDGWFHKTHEQWQQETALTRAEQDTARKRLRALGLLQEAYRGMPRRLWYRVDLAQLGHLLGQPVGCELSRATLRERDRFPWVRRLLGPIQWFHREFAPATGSVPAALLLSTMLSYFQRRARREPSVPYLDLVQADWSRATGMKRDQLDRARSALRVRNMVSEARMGLPPRVTVAIDLAHIATCLNVPVRPQQPAPVAAAAAGAGAVVGRESAGPRPEPIAVSPLAVPSSINRAKSDDRQQQSGSEHPDFRNSPSCFPDSCNLPARFPQISLRDFHTSACRIAANQFAGVPQILYRGLLTTSLRLQPPSSEGLPLDAGHSRGGGDGKDSATSPRPGASMPATSRGGTGAGADGKIRPSADPQLDRPHVATAPADALFVPAFEIPALERSARSLIGHWTAAPGLKQAVLDELAGALHAGRVRNPVRYLQSLISAADNERFVTALGPAVAAARARAASVRASNDAAESALRDRLGASPDGGSPAWTRSQSANASLAAIRDVVGIRRKGDP
ncbi:hypothetical protein [Burkholderia glumae]|uniref:hypothetical protein n=1 Tax=Burkholderia glumae TaxID=337 RepID=UPI0021506F63|nr:hypothetical protein [Burkholderia glumae]